HGSVHTPKPSSRNRWACPTRRTLWRSARITSADLDDGDRLATAHLRTRSCGRIRRGLTRAPDADVPLAGDGRRGVHRRRRTPRGAGLFVAPLDALERP